MDNTDILAVHSMLHLIYHRNKNQHHRAKWWKWLSALKRTTLDLGSIDPAKAAACRQHLASHLIPRCYMAFSTVVADNQFATLGVVLLAALARLIKVTGIEREMAIRVQPTNKKITPVVSATEDRGERISRNGSDALSGLTKAPVPKAVFKSNDSKSSAKHRKKTSKRKKDVIDDLFSGLM
ncbi:hypothetical protein N7523_004512 [Penicillium sp. IBT 18751x]|nr:hypothetical protein N7523_004512 [Penicillium sp. IBT 18751x]